MEQTYLNCWNGATQKCPEVNNEIMTGMLTLMGSTDISSETIEAVNGLCINCVSFEARPRMS